MAQSNKRAIGRLGEDAVCGFLERRGAEILCRNYTIRGGEMDIIARYDDILLFVEVKTRQQDALQSGAAAVDRKKQQRMIRTAEHYLLSHADTPLQTRFDVAEVEYAGGLVRRIRYLAGAFDASSGNGGTL